MKYAITTDKRGKISITRWAKNGSITVVQENHTLFSAIDAIEELEKTHGNSDTGASNGVGAA